MEKDASKKSPKKIILKIIISLLSFWVLLVGIDFVRFASFNAYSPLITVVHNGCKCFECREECGIGYSFDYVFYNADHLQNKTPDEADFKIFGFTVYSR